MIAAFLHARLLGFPCAPQLVDDQSTVTANFQGKLPGLTSSRLDPATEMLIERAVDRLLEHRTGVVIAHRLATVERADDILILDAGRVVEAGPRLDLAGDPGSRFARLLETGLREVLA